VPFLPTTKMEGTASSLSSQQEILSLFAWLTKKTFLNHYQILELPHSIYLAYIKHHHIDDLEQTPEGREYLDKARRYMYPRKQADLSKIREMGGYNTIQKGGEE
jgi:hypothetical protein